MHAGRIAPTRHTPLDFVSLVRGLPPLSEITAVYPVRSISRRKSIFCNHCQKYDRTISEVGNDSERTSWGWSFRRGFFPVCAFCRPRLVAAIDEAPGARSLWPIERRILVVVRMALLRYLADQGQTTMDLIHPEGFSVGCGWCLKGMADGLALGQRHDECKRQMAYLVSIAAVKQSRAVFIGRLALPVDVRSVIFSRSMAACNLSAALKGAARLLIQDSRR